MLEAGGVRREALVVDQLGPLDGTHQALERRGRGRRQRDVAAVLRRVDIARGDEGELVAHALGDLPEAVVEDHLLADEREQRLVDGEVDDLAPPVALHVALVERDHRGVGAENRGERVAEPHRRERGRVLGKAVQMRPAGERLGQRPEAGLVAQRPVLAPAGDAHHDQAGVLGRQLLVAEVPALERAGPEVLDQDVGVTDEALQDLLPVASPSGRASGSACCARPPSTTAARRGRTSRAAASGRRWTDAPP